MKKTIRLRESELRQMISEAVKKTISEKIDYSNFDFSKTNGIDLSDTDFGVTPKIVKEKLQALQNALNDVMDIMNGDAAGRAFSKEMFDKCYDFYNFISKYYVELVQQCSNYEGSWEEDHSDIPFIRKMSDDYGIPNYYGKDGKQIDNTSFRSNFKPRK